MAEVAHPAAVAGYEHPEYAASLSEFGTPILLPRSQGWVLRRCIPESALSDLVGPYPLFFCQNWNRLPEDLAEIAEGAVSVSIVTDPFARLDRQFLEANFDVAMPFKSHFVTELSRPIEAIVSKSHRENVRRAQRNVDVRLCADPSSRLAEWIELFRHLVKRHDIRGIKAFSEQAFARQFAIPGIFVFEAREITSGDVIGLDLWYLQRDIAYGHLAAFNERGYALRASYATKWYVLTYFSGRARYLHFGAMAGTDGTADGLSQFKQGWSTGTLKNYFCGKILNPPAYSRLVAERGAEGISFFPAYREGKF